MGELPLHMLNEMAVFAQVVDSGSFSAAARRLALQTSSVSRHVARLERELGGRLLERSTRALSMTELGQQVYAACTRMTTAAREVHALAGSYGRQPTGTIRVSAPVVFGQTWLAPRIPGFLARYPAVDVELTLIDRAVDLIEEGVDIALRISRDLPQGLVARPLFEMAMVLIAAPDYLALHPAPHTPDELARHRLIHLGYDYFETWHLRQGAATARFTPQARVRTNNSAAIVAMAEAGGGIGLVPSFVAAASLHAGKTVQVLADWTFDDEHCGKAYALYLPGRFLPLKTRAFIDQLIGQG